MTCLPSSLGSRIRLVGLVCALCAPLVALADPPAPSAEAEDPAALYERGRRSFAGDGVPQSSFEGARWLRRAAHGGHAKAAEASDRIDAGAVLVREDPKQAFAFYAAFAEEGDAAAQRMLGLLHREGVGTRVDDVAAFGWLERAAAAGDMEAQGALGSMYDEGRGTERDPAQALVWFRKAALQGHPEAQFNLGTMYMNGVGTPVDHVEAVMWLTLCAEKVASARFLLHTKSEEISPEDLAAGRARASAHRGETAPAGLPPGLQAL